MLRIIDAKDPDYSARLRPLCERSAETPPSIEAAARDVIHEVRRRGDAAVRELTEKFEKRALDALELPRATWLEQASHVAPGVRLAIERAAARVRRFHERETYASFELREGGARVGLRVAPLARVGLYVPGGTARYPSSVLMTAIPAKLAGVPEIVMVTPGASDEALLAARIAGVDRVFELGGAQAIAALAFGTQTVPRVDKIVGPGNAWVASAKRQVYGEVDIDSIAGPSEVVVIAESSSVRDVRSMVVDRPSVVPVEPPVAPPPTKPSPAPPLRRPASVSGGGSRNFTVCPNSPSRFDMTCGTSIFKSVEQVRTKPRMYTGAEKTLKFPSSSARMWSERILVISASS